MARNQLTYLTALKPYNLSCKASKFQVLIVLVDPRDTPLMNDKARWVLIEWFDMFVLSTAFNKTIETCFILLSCGMEIVMQSELVRRR